MAWVDSITNRRDNSNNKNKSVNDSWAWPPVEPGKLNCILCQKVISFFNGNTKEFFTHIEIEHKVIINQWLLLSIIFLDNGTLDEIRDKFRDNLNALKQTGPVSLDDSFVDDDNEESDNDSFGEDSDGFDEEDIFDELTKDAFNDDNHSKSSKDMQNNQIGGDEILENVAKYKPGPKSYKMKQLLSELKDQDLNQVLNELEDQDGMPPNQNDNLTALNIDEKHPKQKETKNILSTLNAKSKGQLTIKKSKEFNENSHPAKYDLENKTADSTPQTQDNRFEKFSSIVPNSQKDQFKPDDTLPPHWTCRKTYRENKKSFDTDFMSPDGRKVRSRVMVVEYMKQMGIYTELDYEKVISKKIFNAPKDDVIPPYKPGPKSRKNKQKLKTINEEGIEDANNDVLKIQREMEDDLNMTESLLKEDMFDDKSVEFEESGGIDGKNSLDYNNIDDDWSKREDLFDISNDMLSGLKRKSNDSERTETFSLKRQKIIEPKSNSKNGIMADVKNMLESSDFDENTDVRSDPKSISNTPLQTKPMNHSDESLSMAEQIKSMLEDDFDEDESESLPSELDDDDDDIERMANQLMDEEMKNLQDYEQGSSKIDNSIKTFANEVEDDIKNMPDFDVFNENVDMEAKEKNVKNKSRKKLHKNKQSSKSSNEVATDLGNNKDIRRENEEMVSEPVEESEHKNSEEFQHSGAKYPIDVKISEYFCKRPNQLSGYNISQSLKEQFVDDENLPSGWKIKKTWRQNKKNYDIEYLSPDGRKARSKVAVIEYMKLLGNYTQQDYDTIILNYDLNLHKINR